MVESGKLTKETCDKPLAHHWDTLDEGEIKALHMVLEILPQTPTFVVGGGSAINKHLPCPNGFSNVLVYS